MGRRCWNTLCKLAVQAALSCTGLVATWSQPELTSLLIMGVIGGLSISSLTTDIRLRCVLQEGWCKKCYPEPKTFQTHTFQPALPDESSSSTSSTSASKRGSSAATSPRTSSTGPSSSSSNSPVGAAASSRSSGGAESPTPAAEAASRAAAVEQVAALTAAADTLGNLLQNHHQVSVRMFLLSLCCAATLWPFACFGQLLGSICLPPPGAYVVRTHALCAHRTVLSCCLAASRLPACGCRASFPTCDSRGLLATQRCS